ncbi:MAG: hypothetical protein AAGB29_11025 [Planctomycetota bacterium]
MTRTARLLAVACLLTLAPAVRGQAVPVTVQPTVTRSIEGISDLSRDRYFGIADMGLTLGQLPADQADYYLNELGITFGRHVNLLTAAVGWEECIFEDPDRPGYVDIERMIETVPVRSRSNAGHVATSHPDGLDLIVTENFTKGTWPKFLETYTHPQDETKHQPFPVDGDHAAEVTMNYIKHAFDDWNAPRWFEGINEPFWYFNANNDENFYGYHLSALKYADELDMDILVGGPCFPTIQEFRDNYQVLHRNLGKFIDGTEGKLDFYAFHPYNYMWWDEDAGDFLGRITGGPPIDGVIDSLASFSINKYDKPIKLVISEFGGYPVDPARGVESMNALMEEHFPDLEGWEYEMTRRSLYNFLMVNGGIMHAMTFMDHPHVIDKAVVYLITQTLSWSPEHKDALLVSKDFKNPVEEWVESRVVDYWKFFKDVKGRRVAIDCPSIDVSHQAFVDDNRLILLFNNVSFEPQPLAIDLGMERLPRSITLRKHGRKDTFDPYFSEEQIDSLDGLVLEPHESIALFVEYDRPIREARAINEVAYYADVVGVAVEPGQTLKTTVDVPNPRDAEYAELRIPVGRPYGTDHDIAVKFNGRVIDIPVEDAAERLDWRKGDTGGEYGSIKKARIPAGMLLPTNRIEIGFPDGEPGGVGAVVLRVARPVN